MSAGELFAKHGIDAVTVRDIAKKAKVNIGIIHYHFKSKERLIKTVMDFAAEDWLNDPLGNYLKKNIDLLKNKKGREIAIKESIKIFFSIIFSTSKPFWCKTLLFQMIQRDIDISRKSFESFGTPIFKSFMKIYHAAYPVQYDHERAYQWTTAIIAPAILISNNPHNFNRIFYDKTPSDNFISTLEDLCIKLAIQTI